VVGGKNAARPQASQPVSLLQLIARVIRLGMMMYVRFPLSLRNVEDLLFERGIDICHETVRMWWNRFGPMSPATSAGSG
jgi:putative transposase